MTNRSFRAAALVLLTLALLAVGCASDGSPATQPIGHRSELPLLEAGTHLGVVAFSPPAAGLDDTFADRWDDANAEATIGRVQLDWIDIEPSQGVYALDFLDERLADVTRFGQAPMLSLVAVDVSGTEFPEWLGGFEPATAAAAYNDMLDAIAPTLREHGVWLLAVANEPPFDEGLDPKDFGEFVAAVRAHSHATMPDLGVTFTFAGGHLDPERPALTALIKHVDVLSVNHYCLTADLTVIELADTEAAIEESIAFAGALPVVFHEFGCPAGEATGSSEHFQSNWFARAFAAIDDLPAVRAAFVFEFSDWSDELVTSNYGEAIAAEPKLAVFFERFTDWLTTGGLVRSDMTPRPAYFVYLDHLGR